MLGGSLSTPELSGAPTCDLVTLALAPSTGIFHSLCSECPACRTAPTPLPAGLTSSQPVGLPALTCRLSGDPEGKWTVLYSGVHHFLGSSQL